MLDTIQPYIEVAIPCPLRRTFDYLAAKLPETISPGTRVIVPFGHRKVVGIVIKTKTHSEYDSKKLKHAIKALDQHTVIEPDIFKLCTWASQYYHHPIGEVFAAALPKLVRDGKPLDITGEIHYQLSHQGKAFSVAALSRKPAQAKALLAFQNAPEKQWTKAEIGEINISNATLNHLMQAGLVFNTRKLTIPKSLPVTEERLQLNHEQQAAVDNIDTEQFRPYLLNGITGSGKTEVYFSVIDKIIATNKQALVLIPEISLTPQTIQRFQQRFNVPVTALHSGLTDKERLNTWLFAKQGIAKIIIGTRSAIFTPFRSLGLIVVDEEHDSSFKQQEGFRYHARDLAILRAKEHNIPVVLGSATPSIESYYNCLEKKYMLLTLSLRAGGAHLPDFQFIDLNDTYTEHGLAEKTREKIQQHLSHDEQVLVFINRRGFSPVLFCQSCRWQAHCSRCDSNMVYHKRHSQLLCHHCGKKTLAPTRCPECQSTSLSPLGEGTQRIAEYLEELFPEQTIVRIDRDSVRNKEQLEKSFEIIHQQQACILVGTQMLAKGHHFPNVTLVVILDVDSGLMSTDFHAPERMAQLILQVSGRAGRAQKPGTVLLQTHQPHHPLLTCLQKESYTTLLKQLLSEREICLLPPLHHLALFRAEAKEASHAFQAIHQIKQLLESGTTDEVTIYDPIAAPMQKKAGFFRTQLLVNAKQRNTLQRLLHQQLPLISSNTTLKNTRWSVDIDPVDLC